MLVNTRKKYYQRNHIIPRHGARFNSILNCYGPGPGPPTRDLRSPGLRQHRQPSWQGTSRTREHSDHPRASRLRMKGMTQGPPSCIPFPANEQSPARASAPSYIASSPLSVDLVSFSFLSSFRINVHSGGPRGPHASCAVIRPLVRNINPNSKFFKSFRNMFL